MSEVLTWATAIVTLAAAIFALCLALIALVSSSQIKKYIRKYIDTIIEERFNKNQQQQLEKRKKGAIL